MALLKEQHLVSEQNKISVVSIISNNEDISDLISLGEDPNIPIEVILLKPDSVINSSLKTKSPTNVKLIPCNDCYSSGSIFNKAVEHVSAPLIILLSDNDCISLDGFAKIIEEMSKNSEIGAASIFIKDEVGRNPIVALNCLGEIKIKYQETQKAQLLIAQGLAKRSLVVHRDALNQAGYLFDAWVGDYCHKLELGLRIQKAGWKVGSVSIPGAHGKKTKSKMPVSWFVFWVHISANRLISFQRNTSFFRFITQLPLLLIGVVIAGIKNRGVYKLPICLTFLPFVVCLFLLRLLTRVEYERNMRFKAEGTDSEKHRLRKWFPLIIFGGFFISTIIFFNRVNLNIEFDFFYYFFNIVLFLGLTGLSHTANAYRLYALCSYGGAKPPKFEIWALAFNGHVSAIVTPLGIGQLLLAPVFKQRYKIPLVRTAAYLALDRIFALIMWFLIAGIGLLSHLLTASYFFQFLLFCFSLMLGIPLFVCLRNFIIQMERFGLPEAEVQTIGAVGKSTILHRAIYFSFLSRATLLILQFHLIAKMISIPIDLMGSWMVMSGSFLAGIASMTPFGVGGRDAAVIFLTGIIGISVTQGTALMLLLRSLTAIALMVMAIIVVIWMGYSRFKKPRDDY